MNRTILFASVAFVAAAGTVWVGCATTTCVANCGQVDSGVDAGDMLDVSVSFVDAGDAAAPFGVSPSAEQDINVGCGGATPTVAIAAMAMNGTTPLAVAWSTDQASIGTVSPQTGTSTTFTPTGTTGGMVNVIATYNGASIATPVLVKLSCSENGGCPSTQLATSTTQLTQGGGVGGVGGEGCGVAVTDAATAMALASPSSTGAAQGLKFLYPYDKTVLPRGMLAPSLQWDWTVGTADAIKIDLKTTSGSFTWSGTFTKPAILGSGNFIRHPIPQDVWEMATNTAGTSIHGQRDDLVVSITLASGGQGYGPVSETLTIAPGQMKGTIYYQSYGTHYATSSWGMGAATLAIKHGATAPILVTSNNRCQACHSVSANGSIAVTDDSPSGDYDWSYDLTKLGADGGAPSATMPSPPTQYGWGGISPDGTLLVSNSAPKWGSPNYGMEGSEQTPGQLFSLPSGSSLVSSAQIATQLSLTNQLYATMPMFSPDGNHVAFNFWQGGPGSDGKSGDGVSLAVVDFNPKTHTFTNLHTIDTPVQGTSCPGPNCADVWPSYLPTSDAIVFHRQLVSDTFEEGGDSSLTAHYQDTYSPTQEGARGELWWIDVATKTAHRLDTLNGSGYLSTSAAFEHQDDTTLQYQPTVAPIASGGYAWVVFTSRRLYGNIATTNPWDSNTQDNSKGLWETQPMTKKLWVAAIDLNAPPGTDPSHPAFYLPAQELMAGNSRGFWALDPCEQDGQSCSSGDECCGGHCVTGADAGVQTCGTTSTCGGEGDSCASSSNCCGGLQCVGGHCDVLPVN